ncbi:MAG: hypothetical protein ACFCUT_12090 [Kiloniellaceae bacterium]
MVDPYKAAEAFVADFREMEYVLKRSGYRRRNKKAAEADWELFANNLGLAFFEHVVATEIAKTLIGHPPRRLLADMQWSPPNPAPLTNVSQLMIGGVCRVRNSYIHGEKFRGGPEGQWERDTRLITEAHAVLREAMEYAGRARSQEADI